MLWVDLDRPEPDQIRGLQAPLRSGNYPWSKDLMAEPEPKIVIDKDSDDSFLRGPDEKYEGGKTLEQKVAELGLKTKPMKLPPREID